MKSGRRKAAILAAAALLGAPAEILTAPGQTLPPAPGDDLSALSARIDEIRGGIERVRGLAFVSGIRPAIVTDAEARARLTSLLRRDYPPEEIALEERELRYFDLIAPGKSLEEQILGALDGQIAGMYDPYEHALFVVEGAAADDMTLAHELVHALADQSFGLAPLLDAARRKDDETLALSAMLEGEATLATMAWMQELGRPGAPGSEAIEAGDASRFLGGLRSRIAAEFPFVGESLIFPYEAGASWAAALVRSGGGFGALDRFFRDPPESTEQILHPEKCAEPRDRPSLVDPGLLSAGAPGGAAETVLGGSFGEFGVRILLGGIASASAVAAAQGWDGDVYRIEELGGVSSMVWISVWDSDEDGEEFRAAISRWLSARAAKGGTREGGSWEARRSGRVVAVCEGTGSEPSRRVAAAMEGLPRGIRLR